MITKYKNTRDSRLYIIEYNECETVSEVQKMLLEDGYIILGCDLATKRIKAFTTETKEDNE